jgi:hypothetical protein
VACGAQITHSIPRWAIPAVLVANSMALLLYNVSGTVTPALKNDKNDLSLLPVRSMHWEGLWLIKHMILVALLW